MDEIWLLTLDATGNCFCFCTPEGFSVVATDWPSLQGHSGVLCLKTFQTDLRDLLDTLLAFVGQVAAQLHMLREISY